MKHIFKREISGRIVNHFLIPNSFKERTLGIKLFSWMSTNTFLLFRTPCILHTFGLKKPIYLTKFSNDYLPMSKRIKVNPNKIIFCHNRDGWVGESWRSNEPRMEDSPFIQRCGKKTKHKVNLLTSKLTEKYISFTLVAFVIYIFGRACPLEARSSSSPMIKLEVGVSKEVVLNQAPRNLNISNPDVLDVQRIGLSNKILVTALSAGESVLIAQFPNNTEKRWNFQVGSTSSQKFSNDRLSSASLVRTAKELQKRTGLEVTVDSGVIAIFGQLSNATQSRGLIDICLDLPECTPRFSLNDTALSYIVEALSQHIKALDYSDVYLNASLGGVIVKGTVPTETDKQRLHNLIQSVIPKSFDQLLVEKANQTLIETELSFFRVSETGLTALGVSTQSEPEVSSDATLAAVSVPDSTAKLRGGPLLSFSFPSLVLKALTKKGVIQQIARPTLVVASGGRGEITSGGEFLFQSGGQVQKFLSQTYGITVVVQPKLISTNKIIQRVDLKITHPQIDPTQKALSSLNSSALSTEVSSKPNEQLLLTRISQKASGKNVSKIPILGHIPIFGELFKARELSGEDAELWITLKSKLTQSIAPTLSTELGTSEMNPNFNLLD